MTDKFKKIISDSESHKVCFWVLSFIMISCFFSYGYLVRGAIVNIVDRQDLENELSVLNSRIITLESEYIKAKKNVTPELAEEMGFVAITSQKFVTKNFGGDSLSLAGQND